MTGLTALEEKYIIKINNEIRCIFFAFHLNFHYVQPKLLFNNEQRLI